MLYFVVGFIVGGLTSRIVRRYEVAENSIMPLFRKFLEAEIVSEKEYHNQESMTKIQRKRSYAGAFSLLVLMLLLSIFISPLFLTGFIPGYIIIGGVSGSPSEDSHAMLSSFYACEKELDMDKLHKLCDHCDFHSYALSVFMREFQDTHCRKKYLEGEMQKRICEMTKELVEKVKKIKESIASYEKQLSLNQSDTAFIKNTVAHHFLNKALCVLESNLESNSVKTWGQDIQEFYWDYYENLSKEMADTSRRGAFRTSLGESPDKRTVETELLAETIRLCEQFLQNPPKDTRSNCLLRWDLGEYVENGLLELFADDEPVLRLYAVIGTYSTYFGFASDHTSVYGCLSSFLSIISSADISDKIHDFLFYYVDDIINTLLENA